MNPLTAKWKSSKWQTLKRWLKSPDQRKTELQSTERYWRLRHRLVRLRFSISNARFKSKWAFEGRKEWGAAQLAIFKTFLFPFTYALFGVVLLEGLEYLYLRNLPSVIEYFPESLVQLNDYLKATFVVDTTAYRSLLAPLITVSGAFLGLYFTALNVLLSSTYKQVTADVRTLLIRDEVGNAYTQIVAFTGSYALLLFGLITIGYRPGFLSLFALVCLGVAEIYSFLNQWFRLFQLFDPARLALYLTQDLIRLIDESTIKANWSTDLSFQTHFQRLASDKLSTYRNLIVTVRTEEHLRSRSLIKLADSLISLLWFYNVKKSAIPSDSKWFRVKPRHKEWLTSSYYETSTATRTGTTLAPIEEPDLVWVEKEIGKIIDFALKGFFEKQDLENAVSLFQRFNNLSKGLAKSHSIEEATLLFRIPRRTTSRYTTICLRQIC